MAQNYQRALLGMGAAYNITPPAADAAIDPPDRRHLAGLFRGHDNANLRRNFAGALCNNLAPVPDGTISQQDVRHLAGVWRIAALLIMPWHLFFGRNG